MPSCEWYEKSSCRGQTCGGGDGGSVYSEEAEGSIRAGKVLVVAVGELGGDGMTVADVSTMVVVIVVVNVTAASVVVVDFKVVADVKVALIEATG